MTIGRRAATPRPSRLSWPPRRPMITCSKRGDASLQTRDFAARNLLYLCRAYPADRRELAARGRPAGRVDLPDTRPRIPRSISTSPGNSPRAGRARAASHGAERSDEAIRSFEAARQTLKEMAGRHGKLVSRMASIQARIAAVDINLMEAYASDPVKYAAACRAVTPRRMRSVTSSALFMPLSWNRPRRLCHHVLRPGRLSGGGRPEPRPRADQEGRAAVGGGSSREPQQPDGPGPQSWSSGDGWPRNWRTAASATRRRGGSAGRSKRSGATPSCSTSWPSITPRTRGSPASCPPD